MKDWILGIALIGIAFWLFVLVPFALAWFLGLVLGAG